MAQKSLYVMPMISMVAFHLPHRFRLICNKIITHKMFDHIVLVIIFLNCITIAMERPKIESHSAVSNQTASLSNGCYYFHCVTD